jgi:hypothetical protein
MTAAALDFTPPELPITIQQGSDATARVTFPDDGTDYSTWLARLQVRTWAGAEGDPLADLATDGVGLSWTSARVLLFDFTADLFADVEHGEWAYDLKLAPPGDDAHARAFLKGPFTIEAAVTE